MSQTIPYIPGTIVYFCHENGIKRGIVNSITTVIGEKETIETYQVAEFNLGDEDTETIVYNLKRNALACDLENMKDQANARIYSFRQAETIQRNREDEADDIFA